MKNIRGWIIITCLFAICGLIVQSGYAQQVPWVTAEQAKTAPLNSKVNIRAKVLSVLPPPPDSRAPVQIHVVDKTDRILIIIFQQQFDEIEDKDFLVAGAQIDVHGTTDEFRGTRQIKVESGKHIRQVPGSIIPELSGGDKYYSMTIGAINRASVGMLVKVTGDVVKIDQNPKPNVPTKLIVQDKTGDIEIIYWDNVENKLPKEHMPVMGRQLQVSGIVSEYRGKLQLRVDQVDHVIRPENVKPKESAPMEGNRPQANDQQSAPNPYGAEG